MSACLDRYAEGLPDIQDAEAMTFCSQCGGDIYPGEDFTTFEDDFICEGCTEAYRVAQGISSEDWEMFAER